MFRKEPKHVKNIVVALARNVPLFRITALPFPVLLENPLNRLSLCSTFPICFGELWIPKCLVNGMVPASVDTNVCRELHYFKPPIYSWQTLIEMTGLTTMTFVTSNAGDRGFPKKATGESPSPTLLVGD
jgi:hypothetical protein